MTVIKPKKIHKKLKRNFRSKGKMKKEGSKSQWN